MRHPIRPRLERVPVLIAGSVGLLLVVGVLVATSSPERRDSPAWYPRTGAVVSPYRENSLSRPGADEGLNASEPTTDRSGPMTGEGPSTTLTAGTVTAPGSPKLRSAGPDGREGATVGGWRLVASMPDHRGALSDIYLVTGAGTETFIAAGADQRGAVVFGGHSPESWRELPSEGLPAKSYARAVAATQDAVVVAGSDVDGPALWELAGDSWRRISVDGAIAGRAVFADVAVHRGTWVVVGFDGEATGFWVRTPGSERFTAVDVGAVTGPGVEHMQVRAVVANDAGFVAVGQAGGRAVRWTSADGIDWSGEALVGGEEATATGVTAGGDTIVGYDGSGGVIWVQHGGERRLVRLPPPSEAPQIPGTVAMRSGSTVLFGVEAGSVRCWETDDSGRPPRRCERSAAFASATSVGAVVAHRRGLLAVGQEKGSESGQVGVWALGDEG